MTGLYVAWGSILVPWPVGADWFGQYKHTVTRYFNKGFLRNLALYMTCCTHTGTKLNVDIVGEILSVKSTVTDPPAEKNRATPWRSTRAKAKVWNKLLYIFLALFLLTVSCTLLCLDSRVTTFIRRSSRMFRQLRLDLYAKIVHPYQLIFDHKNWQHPLLGTGAETFHSLQWKQPALLLGCFGHNSRRLQSSSNPMLRQKHQLQDYNPNYFDSSLCFLFTFPPHTTLILNYEFFLWEKIYPYSDVKKQSYRVRTYDQ